MNTITIKLKDSSFSFDVDSDTTNNVMDMLRESLADIEIEEGVETLKDVCKELGLDYKTVKVRLSKSISEEHLKSII